MIDEKMRRVKDFFMMTFSGPWIYKVSPSTITTVGNIFGAVCCFFLFRGQNALAFAFGALNRICDGLDGLVARKTGRITDFGGYYDLISDFLVYGGVIVVLAFREDSPLIWGASVVLLAAFYVNGASWMLLSTIIEKRKLASEGRITSLEMPVGVIEGTETLIFYTLFILFPSWLPYTLYAMAFLTFISVPMRLISAWRLLKPPYSGGSARTG